MERAFARILTLRVICFLIKMAVVVVAAPHQNRATRTVYTEISFAFSENRKKAAQCAYEKGEIIQPERKKLLSTTVRFAEGKNLCLYSAI